MNRLPSKLFLFLWLLFPFFGQAHVGMPLSKLQERGIQLSALPGIHKQSVTLSAQTPAGIQLLISLDGNIPTDSQTFAEAITLSKNTPVTIALMENNRRSDTLYSGTYIIGFSSTLPLTTLILPPADLFDPARGIYVGGLTPSGERWGNCWGEQERQAFFELIKENEVVLSQGVGLRIFGGMSRQGPEKSLRVIARKEYGKGKFKYRVFPTKELDEFNSLVLRTSGNDWMATRFQDMMISSLAKDLNIDYMAYQPSVLFVNGVYWGIHNIREKINLSYLEENHGAAPEQTSLIQGLGASASKGTAAGYKELFTFLSTHSPDETGFIDSVEKRLDIDNYFKFLSLQIHIRNVDSRGNIRYWQAKNLDNRFRWIFYDGDLAFTKAEGNYLKDRLSPTETYWYNPPATTFLLRRLTENPTLRERFISQYCFLLSTWLHADTISQRIQFFKSLLEPEIERHLKRKNFNQSKASWQKKIDNLLFFANARMPLAYEHLRAAFGLNETYTLAVQSPLPSEKLKYTIERIPIPTLPYQGTFFKEARVHIQAHILHPRYRFIGWDNGEVNPIQTLFEPSDSVVTLAAKILEIPASPRKGKIWINSIGHGKKDQPRFIEINAWDKQADSLWLVDSHKFFTLTISSASLPLVIVEDTSAFRKLFPDATATLLQIAPLSLKQFGKTLYLLEASGEWIDSVDLLPWDTLHRNKPYWVRAEDGKLVVSQKAPTFSLAKATGYPNLKRWMIIGALALLAFSGIVIMYRKRRSRLSSNVLLLVLFASIQFAWAQNGDGNPTKYRQVDVDVLRQSPLLFRGPQEVQQQSGFYRLYKPIAPPLIWIAPFPSESLAVGDWHNAYTVQTLKELATDPFSVRHMKFIGRTASCWIAGVKKEFFLIDTTRKLYLARIEHTNGLESWYYPLINPVLSADERTPGAVLGATGGFYFWQLRCRTCSILASAIVQSDGLPDPKGFVLENLCPTPTDPAARVKNFSKALLQKFTELGENTNWEKALEEELKKQK
ncbi:MAG: hypothetical protein FJX92_02190 [Bacteroidetes bacterium]|nr:hypothetical protein [Bacteroidota bacterium]